MKIVSEKTLDAFRGEGICDGCGKRVRNREPHHIRGRGQGSMRLDVRINLVALCAAFSGGANCHYSAHYSGKPSRAELLEVVALREGRTVESIVDEMNELRRATRK